MKDTSNVLVLGAGGQIARWVIRLLADDDNVRLTLFLRDAKKLAGHAPEHAQLIEGDVLDDKLLAQAMARQDLVYVNLAGEVDVQMKRIVAALIADIVKSPELWAQGNIGVNKPGTDGDQPAFL